MPFSTCRPVANATLPFWRTTANALDDHRTTENLPRDADIAVIGGGYAGVSTVYHIVEKSMETGTKPSVVILEAREACSGATGRNGGHLKPDPFVRWDATATEDGVEAAEEAAKFEADHVAAIRDLVHKEEIDCDFVVTRAMDVSLEEPIRDELKEQYDRTRMAGISTANETFYAPPETAEALSGVKGAKGAFSYTAGHIWPYKLVLHLLNKIISQGVNLQTHTPVQKVSQTRDQAGKWSVITDRGTVKAKIVIHASNAYTSAILPEYKDKIVPVRGVCCRIVTPTGKSPYLSNSYIIRASSSEYDYLIPRADGSIIVGGGKATYQEKLENWYDNVDDSEVLEPTRKYFNDYMQRTFHGWENSGAYVDKIWTGIMGYSSDNKPHVGEVPGKTGQYICAGFTGHGMPQAFLSAKGVAAMVVEGKAFEKSGVPRVFRTSQERLDKNKNKILEEMEGIAKAKL